MTDRTVQQAHPFQADSGLTECSEASGSPPAQLRHKVAMGGRKVAHERIKACGIARRMTTWASGVSGIAEALQDLISMVEWDVAHAITIAGAVIRAVGYSPHAAIADQMDSRMSLSARPIASKSWTRPWANGGSTN